MIPKIAAQDGWLVIMATGSGTKPAGSYTLRINNLEITASAMKLIEKMGTTIESGPNLSIEEEDGEYVLKYVGSHFQVVHPEFAYLKTDIPSSILHYILRKRVVADSKAPVPIEVVSHIAELHSLIIDPTVGEE